MRQSARLAGAIAVGVLCQPAISETTHADYYAFGNTLSSGYAILDLVESNGNSVFLTTLGVQGWISPQQYGLGGPGATNTDYTVGFYAGDYFNNYFGFNLAGPVCEVATPSDCFRLPTTATVTAATLTVYSGTISANLTYTLYGASQLLSQLEKGSPNANLYEEMMSGAQYGIFALPEADSLTQLEFPLNSNAFKDIDTAIQNQSMFAIAGYVDPPSPVPEPSTWVMMLAGFAGLGVVARRRAARRRATAST